MGRPTNAQLRARLDEAERIADTLREDCLRLHRAQGAIVERVFTAIEDCLVSKHMKSCQCQMHRAFRDAKDALRSS